MTYAAFSSGDHAPYRDISLLSDDFGDFTPIDLRRRRRPGAAVLGAAALMLAASTSLLALHHAGQPLPMPGAAPAATTAVADGSSRGPAPTKTAWHEAQPAAMVPLRNRAALFDPTPVEAAGFGNAVRVGLANAFDPSPIMPPPEAVEAAAAAARAARGARQASSAPVAPAAPAAPAVQTASLANDTDEASTAAPAAPVPAVALPAIPAVPGLSETIPLPMPRPAFRPLAATPRPARLAAAAPAAPAAAAPAKPGFFEQVFGGAASTGPALAYANPEDGGSSIGGLLGRRLADRGAPDNLTAVYDIAAHTVTLPDGTRLEAHSGLGAMRDNPYSVTERMRGATPPNVYELTLREAVFHGVRALRLTPTGGTTFGRGGLLAHTYMLGPNGDSNGCVVFRNYKAFLDAYESGRIRRLAVVARAG